jgi:hypothetical protein
MVIFKRHGVCQCHARPTGKVGNRQAREWILPGREAEVIKEEVVEFQREGVAGGRVRRRRE